MRFSLKTAFVFILVVALATVVYQKNRQLSRIKELAEVQIEVFDDREEFENRLRQFECVDFDDVDTSSQDFVAIKGDRYAAKGLLLNSAGGFFVGRTFGFPLQYPANSKPNTYSSGPVGVNPGGGTTQFSFTTRNREGLAAGFGAMFVDVDHPTVQTSGLRVFGWDNRILGESTAVGMDGKAVFRGIIAVDDHGKLVPAISRVEVTCGSGWPGVDAGDGATLDDVVFGRLLPNDIK